MLLAWLHFIGAYIQGRIQDFHWGGAAGPMGAFLRLEGRDCIEPSRMDDTSIFLAVCMGGIEGIIGSKLPLKGRWGKAD